jgi:hypothetical protein
MLVMSDQATICDESGCGKPSIILIAGVGYCADHALKQIGRLPPPPRRGPTGRPKRKIRPIPSDEID